MDITKILRSSQIFSTLSLSAIEKIASLTTKKHFDKGEYLVLEGTVVDFCYLIQSGRVKVFRDRGYNKKWPLAELEKGAILGELSIIDGLPRSASVIALEPTEALAISAADFKKQMEIYPEIALELLPILANRLRTTQDQLYIATFLLP